MPNYGSFQIPFNPGLQIGEQVIAGMQAGTEDRLAQQRQDQLFKFQQADLDLRQQIADQDKLEKEAVVNRDNALADEARFAKIHTIQGMLANENQTRMFTGQPPISMQDYMQQIGVDEHGNLLPGFSTSPRPAPKEPTYTFHPSVPDNERLTFGLFRPEVQAKVSKAAPHLFIPSAPAGTLENSAALKNWTFHPDVPEASRSTFLGLNPETQQLVAAGSNGRVMPAPDWTTGLSQRAASYAQFIDSVAGNFAPEDKQAIARVIEQNINGDKSKISAFISKLADQYTDPKQQTYAQFRNQGMSPADAERATEKAMPPKPTTDEEERQFQKAVAAGDYQDTTADRLKFHQAWGIKPIQPGAVDARLDRSYQFNSAQLEKMRTPIDQRAERLTRVMDAINQKDPQADSLIAPELLSVMAGGQGSGLRMNESEIARIVGGRSNWEAIQAALNKWKPNDQALSITDSQRAQMLKLVNVVNSRVQQKQQILSDAEDALNNASTVGAHRQILADARRKLAAVDNGAATASGKSADPAGIF